MEFRHRLGLRGVLDFLPWTVYQFKEKVLESNAVTPSSELLKTARESTMDDIGGGVMLPRGRIFELGGYLVALRGVQSSLATQSLSP